MFHIWIPEAQNAEWLSFLEECQRQMYDVLEVTSIHSCLRFFEVQELGSAVKWLLDNEIEFIIFVVSTDL